MQKLHGWSCIDKENYNWQVLWYWPLKGQCQEIFCFCFFHESVSPKPLIIPLGPFRIFSKIRGDIHSSRFATGVVDTVDKWKKSLIRNFFFFFWTPLERRVSIQINFFFKFIFSCQQLDNCSHYLPPVRLHRWQISCRCCWYRWQFATGVDDTGGKLAPLSTTLAKMVENFATGGAPWLANISVNFRKNSKRSEENTLELGGNWFMKKTRSKNLVALSF